MLLATHTFLSRAFPATLTRQRLRFLSSYDFFNVRRNYQEIVFQTLLPYLYSTLNRIDCQFSKNLIFIFHFLTSFITLLRTIEIFERGPFSLFAERCNKRGFSTWRKKEKKKVFADLFEMHGFAGVFASRRASFVFLPLLFLFHCGCLARHRSYNLFRTTSRL